MSTSLWLRTHSCAHSHTCKQTYMCGRRRLSRALAYFTRRLWNYTNTADLEAGPPDDRIRTAASGSVTKLLNNFDLTAQGKKWKKPKSKTKNRLQISMTQSGVCFLAKAHMKSNDIRARLFKAANSEHIV